MLTTHHGKKIVQMKFIKLKFIKPGLTLFLFGTIISRTSLLRQGSPLALSIFKALASCRSMIQIQFCLLAGRRRKLGWKSVLLLKRRARTIQSRRSISNQEACTRRSRMIQVDLAQMLSCRPTSPWKMNATRAAKVYELNIRVWQCSGTPISHPKAGWR